MHAHFMGATKSFLYIRIMYVQYWYLILCPSFDFRRISFLKFKPRSAAGFNADLMLKVLMQINKKKSRCDQPGAGHLI